MTIDPGPAASDGQRTALVVGATGIAGSALVEKLAADGWPVLALSRTPGPARDGVRSLAADLTSAEAVSQALEAEHPTHVFFTAWSRQETEEENIRVNAGMLRDLLGALRGKDVAHVALMTGMKHYLGPFEAYASGEMSDTPFREDAPRLSARNFYYAQEDELFAAAEEQGFTWSVHRAHTVLGYAVGNAMNMGLTLATQAALAQDAGEPFVFPGSEQQWNGLANVTDAGVLAEHMLWASTTDEGADQAFNIVDGDVFRWRWMWPRLAAYFGLEWEGYAGAPRPLEQAMHGREDQWRSLAEKHGLVEPELGRMASWWHTDGDLGLEIEAVVDMTKSRTAGFTGYRNTLDVFTGLFDRYRAEKLIP
ncbi:SDR family oxidoreductase [Arthrobacter agilis]|uniref:SDR family oxidoreductase n=1 Tax=Arthrobacter agilis TaxID=37921 RepID=UPI00236617AE|nr:SDR family oxidoreductase [Arthrobacter agilis]WDF33011.1 SDR family oxidoreductase [Arthrobacter agilis]